MPTKIPLISTSRFYLTINRPAPYEWVLGVKTLIGEPTTFNIIANVQPLNPDELVNMPEDQRTRETLKLYTATLLLTTSEIAPLHGPDSFVFDGLTYQVQQVMRYKGQHLGHNKAICVRLDAGTS